MKGMVIISTFTYQVNDNQVLQLSNLKLVLDRERSTIEIEERIMKDKANILKICNKYRGSKRQKLEYPAKIQANNFYINEDRKLGWCVNAKVSNCH